MLNRPFRILVIDDEQIVCERLTAELERAGFEAHSSSDSTEAVQRISSERFDLVITDIKMRGPSGIDVLRFVKEQSPATRVIVITGFATVDTAREVLKAGATDFIPKPFKMSQLREMVQKLATEGPGAGPRM